MPFEKITPLDDPRNIHIEWDDIHKDPVETAAIEHIPEFATISEQYLSMLKEIYTHLWRDKIVQAMEDEIKNNDEPVANSIKHIREAETLKDQVRSVKFLVRHILRRLISLDEAMEQGIIGIRRAFNSSGNKAILIQEIIADILMKKMFEGYEEEKQPKKESHLKLVP